MPRFGCIIAAAALAIQCAGAHEEVRPVASFPQATSLQDLQAAEGRPFDVTATVVAAYPFELVLVKDSDRYFDVITPEYRSMKPGMLARFRGNQKISPGRILDPYVSSISVIGSGELPKPKDATVAAIAQNVKSPELVRVRGTITDAFKDEIDTHWSYMILKEGPNVVSVALANGGDLRERLPTFIDAEVELTGIAHPAHAGFRKFIGPLLRLWGENCIKVTRPAPQDPFSLPDIDELDVSSPAKLSATTRHTAAGTVIAVWDKGKVLLRRENGSVVYVALANPSEHPATGDRISVVGYPETDLYRINLSRAQFRKDTKPKNIPQDAEDVSPEVIMLDEHGRQMIKPNYHGRLVRMTGIVRALPAEVGDERLVLLECGKFLVPVDVSAEPEIAGGLEVGCRAAVTGVCVLESPNWRPSMIFPRIDRMLLVPRTAEDFQIVSRPPWWTPGRLLAFIGTLFLALVGILIWNLSLRRLAERRGRELYKADISKAAAELRIDERSRLAAELHDSLAQNMTGISFQIAAARNARKVSTDAEEKHLATAERMLLSSRTELRRCIWDLRSESLDEKDFSKAIQMTVQPVIGKTALEISCDVERSLLSDSTAHSILSVIRELSANAASHGKASHVKVKCEDIGATLRFTVSDDGCGFDPARCPGQSDGHFGISGIRERAKRLDGKFTLNSVPGKGTTATIEIQGVRKTVE